MVISHPVQFEIVNLKQGENRDNWYKVHIRWEAALLDWGLDIPQHETHNA